MQLCGLNNPSQVLGFETETTRFHTYAILAYAMNQADSLPLSLLNLHFQLTWTCDGAQGKPP